MSEDPRSPYALFRSAQALLADGRPRDAVEVAESLLRRLEQDRATVGEGEGAPRPWPSVHELLGRARYVSGDHEGAALAFEHLTGLEPTNAYAHFGLGRALERLGSHGEALAHMRLAVALSDRRAYAQHMRRLESRMGDAA